MRAIRTPSEDNFRRNEEMERGNHHAQYQPPMNQQHSIDQRTHHMLQAASTINPFHSPYIDPVGSIIGLRVLYIDGRMCYVPVEPQLNFMINQHFGRIGNEQSGEERLQPRSIIQELQNRQSEGNNRTHYEEKRGMNQEGKATTSSSGVSSLSGEPETMDDPPWARPHPQPANGKRGTAAWRNEFPRKSSMNRQPPGGFSSDLFGTGLTSASTNNSHASRRPQQAHVYEPPPAPENRTRNPPRERSIPQQPEEEYNPWGRGGGGAPLRDGQGNIVADRRRLGASWSRSVDTNETHHLEKDRSGNYLMHSRQAFAYQDPYRRPSPDYHHQSPTNHQPFSFLPPIYPPSHDEYPDEYANRRGGGGSSMAHATSMPSLASKQSANLSSADQHREELQRQIDDNRRRKEAERLKEIEMEKKEIQRWEERNARIRAEEEEAKMKAREKALAIERKREAQAAREEQRAKGRRTPPPQMMPERRDEENEGGERKLEWWEKKPTWDQIEREPSAIIPALRDRRGARTPSAPSRVTSASGDRGDSRQSYRPADSVRQHSARRRSLVQTPVQQTRAPPRKAEAFTIMG